MKTAAAIRRATQRAQNAMRELAAMRAVVAALAVRPAGAPDPKKPTDLPPAHEQVLVWGRVPRLNVLPQWWQARLWSAGGLSVPKMPTQWLTPCDDIVIDVTEWAELPKHRAAPPA